MLNADKTKNYNISDRRFIFNKFQTYSTYGQQTYEYPNEIYQNIIDKIYYDQEYN